MATDAENARAQHALFDGPHEVVYKTVANCAVTADIWLPARAAAGSSTRAASRPASEFLYAIPSALLTVVILYRPQPVIFLHGGGFMLGHARMNSKLQIHDCLQRGWIVIAPNYRLCPQVNLLEGPIRDTQDLLLWIRQGHADNEIKACSTKGYSPGVDQKNVFAMGTSAGGNLAYSLAYESMGECAPPRAILDFYGAKSFRDPFWAQNLPFIKAPPCTEEMTKSVFSEIPVATKGGVSLEGQTASKPPSAADQARLAYMLDKIKTGKVVEAIYPASIKNKEALQDVDPLCNIRNGFPPVCIVHGTEDVMVPMHLSTMVFERLQAERVPCKFIAVPGQGHTFAGQMKLGDETWKTQRKGFDWLEDQIVD